MRRHFVIGHFGPLDKVHTATADGIVVTKIDLVSSNRRLDYGIDHALEDLKTLGLFPTEMGLDFVILAALVHAADTRISRATESQDTWTREFRLSVPVSVPDRWTTAAPILSRMLGFLTGDRWDIGFRPRPAAFSKIVPSRTSKSPVPPFDSLSLFSGGLDSLIGAIDLLEGGDTPLLVSHAGEGATSDSQNSCFEALRAKYKSQPFNRLRVWMNFPEGIVRGVASEKTTRGRSFLFFALGVFAGTAFAAPFTLRVPENGLIALNVPLDTLRLGALSTRTTHPFYMARWNEILDALEIRGRVENPYWNKTKGEMADECRNQALLHKAVKSSLSCSSPAKARWQGHPVQHCGYCLPCLIRHAAIERAWGKGKDPTTYTIGDLRSQTLDPRHAEGQQVRAFQLALARLRARPDLEKFLIHKPGPLTDVGTHLDELAAVYRRGMEEVGTMLNGVRTRAG